MSGNTQSSDNDQPTEQVSCDCDHTVPAERIFQLRELTVCDECYVPFNVTQWPAELGTYEYRVIEGRGATTVRYAEYLLGLDQRGRALYYNENDEHVQAYVPMHDPAYHRDRRKRAEALSEYHHTTTDPGQSVLRSARATTIKPDPAPATPGEYVTLPNGDHIVPVERIASVARDTIEAWVQDTLDRFAQFRPNIRARFGVLNIFGEISGKPFVDRTCRDCGHTDHSVDPHEAHCCAECGSTHSRISERHQLTSPEE